MKKLVLESLVIGLITTILGNLVLKILLKFNTYEKNDSLNNNLEKINNIYLIHLSLFFTGVLIHVILEYIGLNDWYCKKVCAGDKCKIVCEKPI